MSRKNVTIDVLNGGLGRRAPNTDMISGMVTTGVAVGGGLTLGTIYTLKSILDLEALGVDAAYDSTNVTLIHHHVDRFFFRNPDGELRLLVAAQTVTLAQLCDKANAYAKKLLRNSNGDIKQLAVIRNPASGYTPTLTTGLDADVIAAVAKAQELRDDEASSNRLVEIFLEGRSFNGTASSAVDLHGLSATNVSVIIGADPAISAGNTLYHGYAAVGDFLGTVSKAAVSQNAGELIADFNLQSTAKPAFLTAGLSSNNDLLSYSDTDLGVLDDKGYIFADIVQDVAGYHWNDTYTCDVLENNDYFSIEANRTIDKAIRLARKALLPKVKSRLKVDPGTGQLATATREGLNRTAVAALEVMQTDGDISGGIAAWIDPTQNLLSSSQLVIRLTFIPEAIGREIVLKIGFDNPLNRG